MHFPPALKKKDLVALTCPAGYLEAEKAATCISTLQEWGYKVITGKTLGSDSENYFSGTDDERREELQSMLDDTAIKAIFFGRGGYGVSRIIDQLDFKIFRKNPKWLIGFSDITVLHAHLYRRFKMPSIHAQMAAAYNDGGAQTPSILLLHKMLSGKKLKLEVEPNKLNRPGKTEGILVGGNLSLFANIIGTASEPDTKNCILFLEDIGEYLYSADRLLIQLKRSGKLKNLAGLVFGGFTDMKDTPRPFGKTMEQVLEEIVSEYNYPVCYHFPVSHTAENLPLKIGVHYGLTITSKKTVLQEL